MQGEAQNIVDGLVREFLVKRGLEKTLQAFNEERPKHENSITKREVLRTSLGLGKAAAKWRAQNPGESSLPPTLELWVQYQMSKLTNNFFDVPAAPAAQAPRQERVSARQALDEDPEEVSVPEGPATFGRTSRSSRPLASEYSPSSRPPASGGFMGTPSPSASPAGSAVGLATRRMADMDIREPDSGSSPVGPSPGRLGMSRPPPRPMAPASPAAPPVPAPPAAAARPAPPMARRGMAAAPAGGRHGEMVIEDVDDLDADLADLEPLPMGGTVGSRGGTPAKGAVGAARGTPLSPDNARALRQLLWGTQGQPPASWKQGFFFNCRQDMKFGLLQREGGPCGVLAAVQAHILAALRSPANGAFNLNPGPSEQRAALVSALTDVLWQAHIGPVAVLALAATEAGVPPSSVGYDQLMRSVVTVSASSKLELEELVRGNLGLYMDEAGWGLVLCLLSVSLSRGINSIRGDMDEPNNALMGMHGYCTQELVNLVLLGQAVSNVFDGVKDLDGSQLKGITRKCRLGLLTLFEWYKYVEVGHSLKSPELPVWVICSESHFTVLFAQDTACLRGAAPFDLLYYDELANQDHLIRLTVAKDPRGGWTARVGDTIGDRGKCEGQNIPPLECVIETRWPGSKVDWHGTEPIL